MVLEMRIHANPQSSFGTISCKGGNGVRLSPKSVSLMYIAYPGVNDDTVPLTMDMYAWEAILLS